jgi:hypothetical protein
VAFQQEHLPGVREQRADPRGGGQDRGGAQLGAAVAAVDGGVLGGEALPGQRVDRLVQFRLVLAGQEGDRLRRFSALLPCEVVVTAVTHPLHGCRLRAYAVRRVDGVPHLKVELPDGMPGLVAAEATDALGTDPAGAGTGLVLDGDGLRRLRAVVMRLRDGDAPGARRLQAGPGFPAGCAGVAPPGSGACHLRWTRSACRIPRGRRRRRLRAWLPLSGFHGRRLSAGLPGHEMTDVRVACCVTITVLAVLPFLSAHFPGEERTGGKGKEAHDECDGRGRRVRAAP